MMTLILGKKVTILVTCFLKVTSMCSIKNAENKHGMACFLPHSRYSCAPPHAWERPGALSATSPRSPRPSAWGKGFHSQVTPLCCHWLGASAWLQWQCGVGRWESHAKRKALWAWVCTPTHVHTHVLLSPNTCTL